MVIIIIVNYSTGPVDLKTAFARVSACLPACLPVSICLPACVCLSAWLPACLSVCRSVSLSVRPLFLPSSSHILLFWFLAFILYSKIWICHKPGRAVYFFFTNVSSAFTCQNNAISGYLCTQTLTLSWLYLLVEHKNLWNLKWLKVWDRLKLGSVSVLFVPEWSQFELG